MAQEVGRRPAPITIETAPRRGSRAGDLRIRRARKARQGRMRRASEHLGAMLERVLRPHG